jgi:hypothetical protein
MLEIFLLYALGKNIAEKAENQGKGGALFVILLIVLWFLGEIIGAAIGVIVTHEVLYGYLWGIVGAGVGAVLAYTFLAVLPLFESAMQVREYRRPRRRRRSARRADEDREDDDRRERRRRKAEEGVYQDLEVIDETSTDFEIHADDLDPPGRRAGGEIQADRNPRHAPPPRRRPRGDED